MKQQGSISQAQNTQQQQQQPHLSPSAAGGSGGANNIQRSSGLLSQMWNNGLPSTNHNSAIGANHSGPMTNPQLESINVQQNQLREQIMQSEQNLSAQHGVNMLIKNIDYFKYINYLKSQVLMQQQQTQTDEAIQKAQNETLMSQADANNIRLTEFDTILQPIVDSCTKDSISTGNSLIYLSY